MPYNFPKNRNFNQNTLQRDIKTSSTKYPFSDLNKTSETIPGLNSTEDVITYGFIAEWINAYIYVARKLQPVNVYMKEKHPQI